MADTLPTMLFSTPHHLALILQLFATSLLWLTIGASSFTAVQAASFPSLNALQSATAPSLEANNLEQNEDSVLSFPAEISFDTNSLQLTLQTLNMQWQIALEHKQLLGTQALAERSKQSIPLFYSGVVRGKELSSWVRLTSATSEGDTNNEITSLSGHLFVDKQLYELTYDPSAQNYLIALVSNNEHDRSLLFDANNPFATNTTQKTATSTTAVPRAIRIGIAVDSRYNDFHNGRGLAHALSIINGVDGLFQEQLGLAVIVDNFKVYDTAEEDPIRPFNGSVEQLLEYYREFRISDSSLPTDLALVHLFSGHGDPDKVIGLGWIDSLCRDDGYDLSLSTPYPFAVLLAAHEIAHNLGAVHDDDAQCNNDSSITGSQIMWSEISGQTRLDFSACSVNLMRNALSTACVADNIDVGLNMQSSPATDSLKQHVQISAFNSDSTRIGQQVRSQTQFPAGTILSDASAGCTIDDTLLTCQHGDIAARAQSEINVMSLFDLNENSVIISELLLDQFVDTEQLNNRSVLRIDMSSADDFTDSTSEHENTPPPVNDNSNTDSNTASDQAANPQDTATGGGSGIGSLGPVSALGLLVLALLIRLSRCLSIRQPKVLLLAMPVSRND